MTGFPPRSLSGPASGPESGLTLPPGEIHVWSVRLDPPQDRVEAFGRLLSDDEWARANRFRFDRHRRQYVVGRGALRTLLGAYLGTRPEQVTFSYGPRGKPFLEGLVPSPLSPALSPVPGEREKSAEHLYFNLSNSDEMALIAFVLGREIGADIEYLKRMPDCEQIAERFFSESERVVLRGIPAERKEEAFFNCWTRKEAYLKAVGEGLAAPLDSFDVTLAPGEPPRMLTLKGDAAAASKWLFEHLRPAPDFIGAIALEREREGEEWAMKTWSLV